MTPHFGCQPVSSLHEFPGRELVGRGGAAVDEVGDAETAVQQLLLLRRVKLSRGKSGEMQRRPETVARTREVMTGGGGVKPRVDADEEDL